MGREDVPQSTKRSNEAERRRGEGKNAGRKAGRPKAVNQDGEISPKNPEYHIRREKHGQGCPRATTSREDFHLSIIARRNRDDTVSRLYRRLYAES
ncbi:hypothetical protein TNCV_4383761 [Trichonephila clavipes]|nr:hypothetical protein TNCV_4383761 [Trichonephila clavipes]